MNPQMTIDKLQILAEMLYALKTRGAAEYALLHTNHDPQLATKALNDAGKILIENTSYSNNKPAAWHLVDEAVNFVFYVPIH